MKVIVPIPFSRHKKYVNLEEIEVEYVEGNKQVRVTLEQFIEKMLTRICTLEKQVLPTS